jgi:hypothetical protein
MARWCAIPWEGTEKSPDMPTATAWRVILPHLKSDIALRMDTWAINPIEELLGSSYTKHVPQTSQHGEPI